MGGRGLDGPAAHPLCSAATGGTAAQEGSDPVTARPTWLTREVALFLGGALLLGVGQQLFVVLRNPWLVARGWLPSDVPLVQATSAGAGVLAGLVGASLAGRVSLGALLVACGLVQAAGFAVQLAAPGEHAVVLAGALLGGFAIQLNTAVTPPFLRAASRPAERVAVFSAGSIALFAAAGLVGLAVVATAGAALTGGAPESLALAVGVVASACAALPFARARAGGGATLPERRWVPGAAPLLTVHVLLALSGGVAVPILQLWFTETYGTPPAAVAGIYATTMVVAVCGHALAPALARRAGLWQAIVLLQVAAVPLLGAMALAATLPLAAAAFLLRHVTNGMGVSLLHLLGQEAVGERHGAALAGLTVLASSAAWATGSALAAPLLRGAGERFGWVFAASIALQALAALASSALLPRALRARPAASGL